MIQVQLEELLNRTVAEFVNAPDNVSEADNGKPHVLLAIMVHAAMVLSSNGGPPINHLLSWTGTVVKHLRGIEVKQ